MMAVPLSSNEGSTMLPVPRTTAERMVGTQIASAPANSTLE
jgi:hypothetical protein